MSFDKETFKKNIDAMFIAYSNPYIQDAIEEQDKSPRAEALVMQPHVTGNFFSSAHSACELYKTETNHNFIPIMFAPQSYRSGKQFFTHKAKLMDVFDLKIKSLKQIINENCEKGIWILQDKLIYSVRVCLIISLPIVSLGKEFNVSIGQNFLDSSFGSDIKSVSIASPKIIKDEFKYLLK